MSNSPASPPQPQPIADAPPPATEPGAPAPAPVPATSAPAAAPPGASWGDDLRAACEQLAARPWVGYAIFAAVALAVYAYAIQNEFVFDDNSTLRKNPVVKDPSRIFELLGLGLNPRNYRPIRYLSFLIDYAIGGDQPWIYHVFNSIYHGLTCFLVWRLLLRLAGDARAALAGALLFALHPAHTECVAYISGRRDLLTTLFYVTGMLSFLRWREAPGRGLGWIAATGGSLFMALGSKEMAVTFPAMIVLYELTFDRAALRRHLPLYGVGFLVAALVVARTVKNQISGQTGPWGGTWDVHAMTAVCLVANYIRLCIFPAELLADYSIDAFPLARSLAEPRVIASALTILVAAGAAIALFRRSPRVAFGIGWFFIALAPVAQIIPYHELGADHYVYLPSVGVCLLAGIGLVRIWDRFGHEAALGLLAVVLVAFGVRTELRIADWRNPEAIYRATVATAPRCARAQLNLGAVTGSRPTRLPGERREALIEALPYYSRAIRIDPGYTYAFLSRGRLYKALGKTKEATRDFERAVELALGAARSPVAAEEILVELERWTDIVAVITKAREKGVKHSRQLLLLGAAHEKLGDHKAALEAMEQALIVYPRSTDGLRVAISAAEALGDKERANLYRARLYSLLTPGQRAQLETGQSARRGARIEAHSVDEAGVTRTAIPVHYGAPGQVGPREPRPKPSPGPSRPGPSQPDKTGPAPSPPGPAQPAPSQAPGAPAPSPSAPPSPPPAAPPAPSPPPPAPPSGG